MLIRADDQIALIGKKMTGKSTLAKILIDQITERPLWIYDYCFDYSRFKDQCEVYYNMKYGEVSEAETFMRAAYRRRNCFCIFDEVDNYFKISNKFLVRFTTTCRNFGIGYIAIGKRAKAFWPDVRAQISTIYAFQLTSPEDIEYLEKWLEYPNGYLNVLRTLEQGEFIIFDVNHTHTPDGKPYHSKIMSYPAEYVKKF